jgi:hypothetical protein
MNKNRVVVVVVVVVVDGDDIDDDAVAAAAPFPVPFEPLPSICINVSDQLDNQSRTAVSSWRN